jgi:DnaD/phage-associated family protein
MVSIPEELFRDTLGRVSDLTELKAVLYVSYLWATRDYPAVPHAAITESEALRSIVGDGSPEPAEERLSHALDRAVANGFLLRFSGAAQQWYLPDGEDGRALLDRLRGGDAGVLVDLDLPGETELAIERPNVFSLYERFIGPLTPLVADQLRTAERSYPRAWIEDAIATAAHYGRRNWRYIEAILLRWEETGGPRDVGPRGA